MSEGDQYAEHADGTQPIVRGRAVERGKLVIDVREGIFTGAGANSGGWFKIRADFAIRQYLDRVSPRSRAAAALCLVGPRTASVTPTCQDQTAITVVAAMIFKALPLDFVNAEQVLPEEIECDQAGKNDRAPILDRLDVVGKDVHRCRR